MVNGEETKLEDTSLVCVMSIDDLMVKDFLLFALKALMVRRSVVVGG